MNVVVRRFMRGNAGITLLEMFVVFLIMSIVMGMLLSAVVSTMASNRLAASVSGVAGAIRTARSLAITSGEIHNVRFIAGNEPRVGVYKVLEEGVYLLRDEYGVPVRSCTQTGPFNPKWFDNDRLCRQLTIYDLAGVRLEYTTSFANPNEILDVQPFLADPLYFYPDGSASRTMTVRIQDGSSTMREVEVLGVTGEITERRAP